MGGCGDPSRRPRDGLHLDDDSGAADPDEQIHLGTAHPLVSLDDGGTTARQEVGSERLADGTERRTSGDTA